MPYGDTAINLSTRVNFRGLEQKGEGKGGPAQQYSTATIKLQTEIRNEVRFVSFFKKRFGTGLEHTYVCKICKGRFCRVLTDLYRG